jgi:hypothetical protein
MRFLLAVAFASLAFLSAGCDKAGQPDTVMPTVRWVSPHDGDTVDPGVYTMVTVATDDRKLRWVAFFVETEMLGMVSQSQGDTYRLAVDCRADTEHVYQLRAYARDYGDNETLAVVTIFVRR